jgi:hypothetical protein
MQTQLSRSPRHLGAPIQEYGRPDYLDYAFSEVARHTAPRTRRRAHILWTSLPSPFRLAKASAPITRQDLAQATPYYQHGP